MFSHCLKRIKYIWSISIIVILKTEFGLRTVYNRERLTLTQVQGQMLLHLHCRLQQHHTSHLSVSKPATDELCKSNVHRNHKNKYPVINNIVNILLGNLVNIWWSHITPNNVTKIRAPLQPIGWPNETAPPCTLTLSYIW